MGIVSIDVNQLIPRPQAERAPGEPCCEPVVFPAVARDEAIRMAGIAKAVGDPIRLQLIDVLRKHGVWLEG